MTAIPREWFIGERYRRRAYADEAVPIDAGQTISQPWIVARMTELLAPRPGDRMLELGTGSGYQAAILAALGADVLSLERHAELAQQARDEDLARVREIYARLNIAAEVARRRDERARWSALRAPERLGPEEGDPPFQLFPPESEILWQERQPAASKRARP